MNGFKVGIGVVIFLVLILMMSSMFVVTQGQQGILLRLGQLVDDSLGQLKILSPGLHFKTPFIESAQIFDTRLQTLDIKSSRIVTKEKKDVIVDYYVKWRISNLAQYFKSTGGNESKAETLLEQQLNSLLRAQFGKHTISELVTGGRDDITGLLLNRAEEQAGGLGMHVVDVRIKGIELPPNTSNAIYQNMRANMLITANSHRADGHAQAEAIQASADAEVTIVLAKASSEAQTIRAKGRAEAASIYSAAFDQNKPFFEFYRSLKAYENSFTSKQDVLVLDLNSAFFKYFNQPLLKDDSSAKRN